MTKTVPDADVLIIGGGPAGLCLADRLQRLRIQVLVLEGRRIGDTWARVPSEMRLVSPWWTNALRLRDIFRFAPLAKVQSAAFLRYLHEFARERKVRVIEGARIIRLDATRGGWTATADDGRTWFAPQVVAATGYFSNPRVPNAALQSDGSIPITHVAEISDYERFARGLSGQKVLIVGKRVSAGQFMVEFSKRGIEVILSANPPVEFRRAGVLGWIRDNIYFVWEAVRICVQPDLKANSYPVMDGGETERLIKSGAVRVVGPFEGVSDGRALVGGIEVPVAHIVLATGYSPAIHAIRINPKPVPQTVDRATTFAVQGNSGLFMLGLDQQRNFLSRYLRGIRTDAKKLAVEILHSHSAMQADDARSLSQYLKDS